MKKFTAIFLLLLLLFNFVGYKIIYTYTNNVLDKQAEISFDQNRYNDKAAFTIKLPLYIPYQINQSTFERVDGKIIIDGKVCRYIKRKIVNNEMLLVCIADDKATELNNSKTDFFKTTAGLVDNNSSKKTGSANIDFFKLLTVYNHNTASYNFSLQAIIKTQQAMLVVAKLPAHSNEPPVQPPDFV